MLGEFEQLILMALVRLRENAYGVSMRKEIEERTGRSISAGAIYTALDRLETRGFVSSRLGDPKVVATLSSKTAGIASSAIDVIVFRVSSSS